ncbi:AAA family ATPase [Bacteroidales bacterium OttesenSCG-928-K03]|nr:AAA family ATPase [Odoribacter sp. OttesenSCG-928-L07]MDL2238681.1 AAA family ATPase [Bacteroidales bacterium OttesenSCG-928-L14]MDL2241030.1 AAA family ATPase [Bacteroidales bacterium OttesenSCG-928-K22]MDL2242664.1 AAA family ATPase [Bacteroidales bacterium OttesenSCG-928-K03]
MYNRKQAFIGAGNESIFFWGARQTGKSTLLKILYPNALTYDLLLSRVYNDLIKYPDSFIETVLANLDKTPVIIDEIQRLPNLLNEIQWLIVNHNVRFILSGSSPRKIIRSGANLLGGRALRYELYPLTYSEIPNFDLIRAINHGLLPRHYDSANPKRLIASYIGNYLRDEIVAEAKIRNVEVFSRFLEAAAFTNGEMVNYTNIAADCGVSATTIKEYFQILQDTLLGRFLPSFQKKPKRKVIHAPKFYLFDVGIANYLLNRGKIEPKTELFGKAFEHFIYQEIYAHSRYTDKEYPIYYWRTTSNIEVDFILGDHEVAIEVKSTDHAKSEHLKGLKAFAEEYEVKKKIVITTDPLSRLVDDILILPWQVFLEKLWADEII